MRDPSRYDDKHGFFKEQPDKKSYELASKCRVMGYARVAQDLSQMKVPWAPNGRPSRCEHHFKLMFETDGKRVVNMRKLS